MRSRRFLSVKSARVWSAVSGWGAKDYIELAGGRPSWSNRHRAWMTSPKIAADVVAMAEHDGYFVTYKAVTE